MFQPRIKGQRLDKSLLPFPCSPKSFDERELFDFSNFDEGVKIGTFEVYGAAKNSFGYPIELLCITLNDGTKVPASRMTLDNKNWCVCQSKLLKAIFLT